MCRPSWSQGPPDPKTRVSAAAPAIGTRGFSRGFLRTAKLQRPPRFFDAPMPKPLAKIERGSQALFGKFLFTEAQVGETAEVETGGASPGVLTVRVLGAVERVAGVLEGFASVAGGEVSFGECEADVDGVSSEAAGVGEEDAGVGLGYGLGVIAEMAVEFGGCVSTTELKFD